MGLPQPVSQPRVAQPCLVEPFERPEHAAAVKKAGVKLIAVALRGDAVDGPAERRAVGARLLAMG